MNCNCWCLRGIPSRTLTDDGIGRNNSVHASLLSWRGRPGNWYCVLADTLAAAMKMNAELDDPLVASELHAIAKSAHVFIDAKVASGEQQEGLLERASRCGIASGISRRAKNHARNIEWKKRRDGGESLRSIAGSAGVAPNTVKHSLKSLDNAVASISPDFEISSAEPHYLISSLHTDQKSTKEEEEDMLVFDGMDGDIHDARSMDAIELGAGGCGVLNSTTAMRLLNPTFSSLLQKAHCLQPRKCNDGR